jgi:hypothetical protein
MPILLLPLFPSGDGGGRGGPELPPFPGLVEKYDNDPMTALLRIGNVVLLPCNNTARDGCLDVNVGMRVVVGLFPAKIQDGDGDADVVGGYNMEDCGSNDRDDG